MPKRRRVFTPAFLPFLAAAFLLAFTPLRAAMTWHWNAAPSAFEAEISASMNACVATFNTYSNYDHDIGVIYASGTPTADAGYLGQIRFGGSRNYRTAMHEASHWLGTGTVYEWDLHQRYSVWNGTYVTNLRRAVDGPGERQLTYGAHYGPNGANYDSEGVQGPIMVGIIGAYRRDMNLWQGDRTIGIASGTYRLRNRQTIHVLDSLNSSTESAPVKQDANNLSSGQLWQVSLIEGTPYFTLRNVAGNRYLASLGGTIDGSPVGLTSIVGGVPSDAQQWQIVATDSFFFKLLNKANGRALDNLGSSADGASLSLWTSGASWNQQWTFLHSLPQLASPEGVISQGRPVASSSTDANHYDLKGNNGVSGDRWTASSGSFPQWWRVDTGAVQPITKVAIDWFRDGAPTFQYRIEVSDDDVTYTVAANRTANTISGTTADLLAVTGRYVRVTVTGASGGYWAAFMECRVYNEATPMRNVSQFRPVTASSEQVGNLAVNATDIDPVFTRWCADSGGYPAWWQVDLGSAQPVNKAVITWFDDGGRSYRYRIEGSTDGITFTTLIDRTDNTSPTTTSDLFSGTARYVRVTVTGGSADYPSFYDAQIFGATTTLAPPPPSTVAAVGVGSQVNVSWSAVTGATSYTLKRAPSPSGPFTVLASQTARSFIDTTILAGLPYWYAVSTTHAVGEGADSTPVAAATGTELQLGLALDETSGTTAADLSGFVRNAALVNGPVWTSGQLGNAVNLDGIDDHLALPAGLVSRLSDFTIATWINPTVNSAWARAFDFGTDTSNYMFLCPVSGGGTLRFAIKTTSSSELQLNTTSLSAGIWTHVAVTVSGTTATLYVNGIAAATNTAMTLRPVNLGTTTRNYLGRSQFADPYFNGKLDDFRIYSRALSLAEINKLRALAAPSTAPVLAAQGVNSAVTVRWTPVLGATSYTVKRSTAGGAFSTVATVNAASFTNTGLTNGTTYTYTVSAANSLGATADSLPASATPAPIALPAPALLQATETGGVVKLIWAPTSSATSYQIKRATSLAGPFELIATSGTATYSDSNVIPGTTYHYTVSATNSSGTSAPSAATLVAPTLAASVVTLKLDELSGTSAIDSSANLSPGTLVNGPVWTSTGRLGRALVLDGTNDHVTLPPGILANLQNCTVSVWVRPATLPARARIFDFGTGLDNYFALTLQADGGKPRVTLRTPSFADQIIESATTVATGLWTHVAVTFSNDTGTLYLNGNMVGANGTLTLTPASLGSTTVNYLGRSRFSDPYFNGALDEFRIHDRALTPTEVAALATPPLAPAGLTATPGPGQTALSWGTVSGATAYRIGRSTTASGPYATVAGSVGSTSYTDTAVTPGTTYYYTITALKLVAEGPLSAEVNATPASPLSELENWRQTHFGITTDTGNAADADDPDGDGWTNVSEYIAGTIPTDPASVLRITMLASSGDDMLISFPSVTGRLYRVERSETLAPDSWTTVLTQTLPANLLPGTGALIQITDTEGALLPRRFYRVVATRP
jgi:fibronectin type 3 domain-containing protein